MPEKGASVSSPRRTKAKELTADQRKQAGAFARWHKAARDLQAWNIPAMAIAVDYSDSHVRLFDEEGRAGIDELGRYRQPKEDYIKVVAEKTGADERAGLIAAGLEKPPAENQIVVPAGYRLLSVEIPGMETVQVVVADDIKPAQMNALTISIRATYMAAMSSPQLGFEN